MAFIFVIFGLPFILWLMFAPGLWILSKIVFLLVEFVKAVFGGIFRLFKLVFVKLYNMVRYGSIVKKIAAIVIIIAVAGWVINWLR